MMTNSYYCCERKVGGADRGTPTPGTDENLGTPAELRDRLVGPPNFSVRTVGLVGGRSHFSLAGARQ
jgi:hypothetical protein